MRNCPGASKVIELVSYLVFLTRADVKTDSEEPVRPHSHSMPNSPTSEGKAIGPLR